MFPIVIYRDYSWYNNATLRAHDATPFCVYFQVTFPIVWEQCKIYNTHNRGAFMYRIAISIMCYIISVISMYIYAFCMGRYILENKMMQKGVASHRCQEQLYMF